MTLLIGFGVFVLCMGAGILGLALHGALPEPHRGTETKDTVRLVQALIASMATLVLGLLIASASAHFRSQAEGVTELAADLLVLDVALAHVGPSAREARGTLRDMVQEAVSAHVLELGRNAPVVDQARFDAFFGAVARLRPGDEGERAAQARALEMAHRLVQSRAQLMVRDVTDDVQWPFLGVLISWLALLFLAMGLFVRINATIVLAMVAGALAVGGAIFLIIELEHPRTGLLRVSDAPLRFALERLDR
ncbi:hypothetical protein AAFN86_02030 [Roseomonas sp. CAU 1739]|uniref:bestrophin-like domain n=1 Tax=Roseomonas sp. CAU 1739 TaxID=3140364 RepID=UPI00325A6098